jgi:hypothetical protein
MTVYALQREKSRAKKGTRKKEQAKKGKSKKSDSDMARLYLIRKPLKL